MILYTNIDDYNIKFTDDYRLIIQKEDVLVHCKLFEDYEDEEGCYVYSDDWIIDCLDENIEEVRELENIITDLLILNGIKDSYDLVLEVILELKLREREGVKKWH